jgi:hypothetical protein
MEYRTNAGQSPEGIEVAQFNDQDHAYMGESYP